MGFRSKVAIIGAGPAGCMCAYEAKKHADVTLFDFKEPLTTLLYTGGGRCNLAHAEYDFKELAKFYPRGEKFLYSVFSQFSTCDTLDFFEKIGVKTYTQEDSRIFPVSNSASKVRISMLNALSECSFVKEKVIKIVRGVDLFEIKTDKNIYSFDKVVIAVGGHVGYELAKGLGHAVVSPRPALTGLVGYVAINPMHDNDLQSRLGLPTQQQNGTNSLNSSHKQSFKPIQGVSLQDIEARISWHAKKFVPVKGDFIFTHEGISGPLAYEISSICARENYCKENPLIIDFDFLKKNIDFQNLLNINSKKDIKNLLAELVPKSMSEFILGINNIALDKKCFDINGIERDRIYKSLTEFEIKIISPSKEGEVVTSGGVCLDEVNAKTMESKLVEGLYFCGEVLDIDGFCGGFNLQNCWSTGYIAGN